MSLARIHKERILASLTVASAPEGGSDAAPAGEPLPPAGAAYATPQERAAAEMSLRLTHDRRRLKEIRSIDRKIEAKREMLPAYKAWIEGLLAADAGVGDGPSAAVLPTCMIWLIDVGDFEKALDLAEFVLLHDVPMPSHYERDAATAIIEEIAEAALKIQNAKEIFPLEILLRVAELTDHLDIHDEPRAKLMKALGIAMLDQAEYLPADDSREALETTLATLRAAQKLNDRVGVKDRIKRADKLLAAVIAAEAPPVTTDTTTAAAENSSSA